MSEIVQPIREKMMLILKNEEEKTDLNNLAVLSRVGMKVASSTSTELDADATSASSTALIDLGLRLSEATHHGSLMEIILHNTSGYSILVTINEEYIIFGGLSAVYRIGYYLGYLRELAKKLRIIISGEEISEIALSLQEDQLKKLEQQKEEEEAKASAMITPSVEQDKAAMTELLGYLDDWDQEEKEAMGLGDIEDLEESNIVSIPETMMVGISKDNLNIPEEETREIKQKKKSQFKIYEGEVPPGPIDDYTPIDVDGEASEPAPQKTATTSKKLPSLDELPSFDQIDAPDFDSQATEYNTSFILEEESEALDSVLKDLGYEEEE